MDKSSKKKQRKNQVSAIQTFPVPLFLKKLEDNTAILTNTATKTCKKQIINQAFRLHVQGNISEAAKYYQYCINQGCTDPRVFTNYGTILKSLGKLEEAELAQRKAIELKPDYAETHYNLGNTLNDLGKLEEAELAQRKAIELKPDYAEACSNLGSILKDLGNLVEAELYTRKAIELKPDYAQAHFNLGIILNTHNKSEEALLFFTQAISLDSSLEDAKVEIGNIQLKKGNFRDAILYLRDANGSINFDSRNPNIIVN